MSEMISEGALETRLRVGVWEFQNPADSAWRPKLRFGPRGTVLDHVHHHEILWRVHEGALEFLAASGRISSRFGSPEIDENGRLLLRGRHINDAGVEVDRLLVQAEDETGARYAPSAGRRNLVVMRAGANALFPEWKPAPDRSWDIAISYYGEGQPDWGQEYFVPAKGPKWEPIHAFLSRNPEIFKRYDYIWFPDDDIMTTWSNVDDLFQVMRDFDLQLAQPALTSESFVCHAVTAQDPTCLLRFTMFVEGMVPLFRSDALKICLPVLSEPSRFGWGHDWIFPMLLGYPQNKIAIIDGCAVTHTRPAGATTDQSVAYSQLYQIVTKFGARFMDHRVRGRISIQPEPGLFVP